MSVRIAKAGTVKMRTNGYVFVKTSVAGWQPRHRLVASLKLLDRDLVPGERVLHKNNNLRGQDGFDDPENLVVIQQRTTKWKNFRHSRTLYEPKIEQRERSRILL